MLVSDIFSMGKKNISQERIIQSFIHCAFEKGAGATSLSDIANILEIKKASLYNHFNSRDDMYNASIKYCEREMSLISFLPMKALQTIKDNKVTPSAMFQKLITRFFQLYEKDPLFEIFSFIHTEQYFNLNALNIIKDENSIVINNIETVISLFIQLDRITGKSEGEIREIAHILSSLIIQHRDLYIASRIETVRQNPDSSADSLFSLPVDESELKDTIEIVESCLKVIEK